MKCKIFLFTACDDHSLSDLEKEINLWLDKHPNITIHHSNQV